MLNKMQQSINWKQKAADYLSAGFTRSESIKQLEEKGLEPTVAKATVDGLISTSRRKGWKELGIGAAVLCGGFVYWWLITEGFSDVDSSRFGGLIVVTGLILVGDGIRRLGSLLMVTRS